MSLDLSPVLNQQLPFTSCVMTIFENEQEMAKFCEKRLISSIKQNKGNQQKILPALTAVEPQGL